MTGLSTQLATRAGAGRDRPRLVRRQHHHDIRIAVVVLVIGMLAALVLVKRSDLRGDPRTNPDHETVAAKS